jgi:hypothetical protein
MCYALHTNNIFNNDNVSCGLHKHVQSKPTRVKYQSQFVGESHLLWEGFFFLKLLLTLNLLTSTIVASPSNASKWQMGFNSAFKGLNVGKSRKTFENTSITYLIKEQTVVT